MAEAVRSGRHTIEGIEHTWTWTPGGAVGVLALHAGLEGGTGELAQWLSEQIGLAAFVVRQPGVHGAHITSSRIGSDPWPELHAFLGSVTHVVSLHGYAEPAPTAPIQLGGIDRELVQAFGATMRSTGLTVDVLEPETGRFAGRAPTNPVNLSRAGGVQLELPLHIRGAIPGAPRGSRAEPTAELKFAVRAAIRSLISRAAQENRD
jgi:phage replication-related protein YjqB (UPF0714/DUF867 family)